MERRSVTFKFRLSLDERRAIADLALRLKRSQSDAIRFVVTEAARQLTVVERARAVQRPAENTVSDYSSGDAEKV